ncbi:MAG: hypothetical protein K2P14_03715 [Anaeroplasmataceae bacterium]|nr:hypothetical protein [Anaeroplasmataceae bacterium]
MRNPERIEPFLEELGNLWKENCPDWRFGQLISNVLGKDPFYIEEDQALEQFRKFFKK